MNSTRRCSACGSENPCTQQKFLPDNGWVLHFDTFGYYGGFDDNIETAIAGAPSREWILCHGCVVKFLTLFPLLQESLGKGLHPCESDTPCCDFAWRATEKFGKYETDESGKLVPVGGAHYQVVNNGVWVYPEVDDDV